MATPVIERIERGVDRLIEALTAERRKSRELALAIAELEARLARPSAEVEGLKAENDRLRRNATVAAEKIQALMERL